MRAMDKVAEPTEREPLLFAQLLQARPEGRIDADGPSLHDALPGKGRSSCTDRRYAPMRDRGITARSDSTPEHRNGDASTTLPGSPRSALGLARQLVVVLAYRERRATAFKAATSVRLLLSTHRAPSRLGRVKRLRPDTKFQVRALTKLCAA